MMNCVLRLGMLGLPAIPAATTLAQHYTIRDLTVESGYPGLYVSGLSNNGRITGAIFDDVTGDFGVFTRDVNGTYHNLGVLGAGNTDAQGIVINNSGQIAGIGYGSWYTAFRYTNGQFVSLGNLDDPNNSVPVAMNNLGHIVGMARNGDGGWQGFRYFGSGSMSGVALYVGDINDSDKIVGSFDYMWNVFGNYWLITSHAAVWSAGVTTDLGNLGGGPRTPSAAYAINAAGQITGYSTTANGTIHAFLYTAGTMADLGTIPPYDTKGRGIDATGEIIAGSIETYGGGSVGVFVWSNGLMHDLLDLLGPAGAQWSGLQMSHMNDSGAIVGTGMINGESHSFLATPAPCPADFDADGTIDFFDYDAFVVAFESGDSRADFDADGTVDFFDYDAFVLAFEQGC